MSNKLDYLQQKKLSPADEVRELLHSLEERQVKVKLLNSEQAFTLLHDLDQLELLFKQLEPTGLDLLPERSRLTTVQAQLQKQAASLLKALGGAAELEKNRPIPAPSPEQWWWYIDKLVAAQRKQLGQRVAIGLVIVLALLGGVILLFQTVLAPSPEVAARMEAQDRANAALEQGNSTEALAFLEEGLTRVPGDPDLLLFQGVIQELLGDETAAGQSFNQAQVNLNDPLRFYLARSQLELRVGRLVEAEGDARSALELAQDSSTAWLLLAQALEAQQKRDEAISAYQKASDLANASGEAEIYVTARMALARLSGMP
jgi:tetratricopeptide (TPR) repeat protein